MEHCRCSYPDHWGTEDSLCCLSCGLSAPPGTRFHYKKLEHASEFRLLRLFPGNDGDDLECQVFHADISNFNYPNYEAVSYTWGDTTLSEKLETTSGLLRVTKNCLSALKSLRKVTEERILWIDAICIAQEDDLEKNHQIPLMPKIYGAAKRVLIYLGDQATFNDSESLFSLLRNRGTADKDAQQRITKFLSLPWFSRIWILQEVAMARQAVIFVGSTTLDWRYLTMWSIIKLGLQPINLAGHLPAALTLSTMDAKPLKDLTSLISMARSCLSSDPRDRIYGLLGLVDAKAGIRLYPDYTKTVQEVYTDVTVEYLNTYNCLDFLSNIGKYDMSSQAIRARDRELWRHFDQQTNEIGTLKERLSKTFQMLDNPRRRVAHGGYPMELYKLHSDMRATTQRFIDHFKSNPSGAIPAASHALLDLLTDFGRELQDRRPKMRDTTLENEPLEELFESVKQQYLSIKEAVDSMAAPHHTKLLTAEYAFRPMRMGRTNVETITGNLDLPSWVPDYRYRPQLSSLSCSRALKREAQFSGPNVARVHASPQDHSRSFLEIRAVFIDTVQSSECLPGQVIRLCDTYIPFEGELMAESDSFPDLFDRCLRDMRYYHHFEDIRKFAQGRRLALTEMSLAIIPADFEIGDVIAVLYGGTVPYLLRPIASKPGRFQFVGECYLHGLATALYAKSYAEFLGWFKDHVLVQGQQREPEIPWRTIFLE